jgi:hypothetical protein
MNSRLSPLFPLSRAFGHSSAYGAVMEQSHACIELYSAEYIVCTQQIYAKQPLCAGTDSLSCHCLCPREECFFWQVRCKRSTLLCWERFRGGAVLPLCIVWRAALALNLDALGRRGIGDGTSIYYSVTTPYSL